MASPTLLDASRRLDNTKKMKLKKVTKEGLGDVVGKKKVETKKEKGTKKRSLGEVRQALYGKGK